MKKLAKAKRNQETLRELSEDEADWDLTFIEEMNESMKSLATELRSCPKEELVALDEAIEKMLSSSKSAEEKRFLRKFKKELG